MKWVLPNGDGSHRIFDDKKDSILQELFIRFLIRRLDKKLKKIKEADGRG